MLRPGRYKAEHDGDIFHAYRYIMEVKETEKSYIFKMVETSNRYASDQIETMFNGRSKVVLRKDKPCRHAMIMILQSIHIRPVCHFIFSWRRVSALLFSFVNVVRRLANRCFILK